MFDEMEIIKFQNAWTSVPPQTAAVDALNRGADRVERSGALTLATFPGGVVELTQTVVGDYLALTGLPIAGFHAPQVLPPDEASQPDTWIRFGDTNLPLSAIHHAVMEGDQAWLDEVKKGAEEAGGDFALWLKKAEEEAAERASVVVVLKEEIEAARQALGCSDVPVEAPKAEKITVQVSGAELRRLKAFLNSLPDEFYQDAFPVAGMGRLVSPAELIGNPALGGPETFTAG